MTINEFIDKATEGGWKNKGFNGTPLNEDYIEQIVLDPLAWQAVGKVDGWKLRYPGCPVCDYDELYATDRPWNYYMHRMIDALCEGKSIEQFLGTL